MANDINSNYFSWENFHEMADIQSHITYASSLLDKYQWKESVKKHLNKQLDAILAKQDDKVLNISVIGEFSTGKSSFVNALVGFEILAVNIIQGTTVAITIIEYGESYTITLVDYNNQHTLLDFSNVDALKNALFRYSTDSSEAEKINYIKVTVPSPILQKGFRIIDTPGTNSLEQWHEDVTRRAISEISDLSLILMDANRPIPESLIQFVDSTIGNGVKDCLFIANQIDKINAGERSGVVHYIQKKASLSFDMVNPLVLPFSSVAITNEFSKDKVEIDSNSEQITYNSIQSILAYTAQNRIKAQAKKILHLIDNIYTSLDDSIKEVEQQYKEQLHKLEDSKQTDLKPFISSQIAIRQKQFVDSAKELRFSIESESEELINSAINDIIYKIDNTNSLDKLSNYIKNGDLSSDIKQRGVELSSQIENKYKKIKPLFKKQLSLFQKDFEIEFQRLRLLPIKFNVSPTEVDISRKVNTANISAVTTIITDELSKENWAFGGGAAAGAAIGTAIFPGIGTVVGAIAGFVAGGHFAPDTAEVKNKIKSKLSSPLSSYYRSIYYDCMSNLETYINDVNTNISTEINRYYSAYNSEIQKRMEDWRKQYAIISRNCPNTRNEISDINNHKVLIQNIISKIN